MLFPDLNKTRDEINSKGYFIAKNLLSKADYFQMRKEALVYFNKKYLEKNKLPKALRGRVISGMKNIDGYSNNTSWKLLRTCCFNWNRHSKELNKIIEISRKISSFRNKVIGYKANYGSLIEPDN